MSAKRTRKTASLAFVIWLAVLLPHATAKAERKDRSLMHTFTDGNRMVVVTIGDTPSGPRVAVRVTQLPNLGLDIMRVTRRGCAPMPFADRVKNLHLSGISQAQFDRLWSTFMSSGADKYSISPTSSKEFDIDFYYSFDADNRCYAVPRWKASPGLVSVVMQLRSYAKKVQS